MARLSAAKSHLHPRSVGWHAGATLLRFEFVMSPAERWSPKKDPPRLHCHAAVSYSLLSRYGTAVVVSYSLLSRHGTAVVALQCPTDCTQFPLRLG
jgi:hypothetical protein